MRIAESELIINGDGSVFHLHLRPEELADTVILVGDPGRVDMIAEYFIKEQQARQIINDQQLYNFTACKDEKTRVRLATKALRLITKICLILQWKNWNLQAGKPEQ